MFCNAINTLIFRAVHHDPRTQYRSNRKEYRTDRIERLDPCLEKKCFFVIWGHTDLRISLSEAKFDAEADFDVRSAVAPPKPHQIDEKLIFRSENFAEFFFSGAEIFDVFSASKRRTELKLGQQADLELPDVAKDPKIYRMNRIDRSDRAID